MQQLSLLRHAKALPGTLRQEDKHRSLSPRGVADARRLGEMLAKRSFMPDLVLCSSAVRTRETLRCLQEGYGNFTPSIHFEDDLYHATPEEMLEVASRYEAKHILIIGHNPGTAELYAQLKKTALESYPTTTLTSFDTKTGEELLKLNGGTLDDQQVPFVA